MASVVAVARSWWPLATPVRHRVTMICEHCHTRHPLERMVSERDSDFPMLCHACERVVVVQPSRMKERRQ